ncbi:integrase core domain-containing protein [Massilia sp. Root418]|uniref:integrase core domain-containing protein n=1 Tax=Massilia sp. Root418 TaxID=1736532 RepID=UPI001E2CB195|nr:integrase core domain-containing protein [Massilia sp. Root418]
MAPAWPSERAVSLAAQGRQLRALRFDIRGPLAAGKHTRQLCGSLQHASRVIGDWIQFYNHKRSHQALRMQTPAAAFALAE